VVATGSGYVKCLTCHAPHGAAGEALTTMPTKSAADASAPLCQNCHK
jgi:predicted CXXCH cytochrome family protein